MVQTMLKLVPSREATFRLGKTTKTVEHINAPHSDRGANRNCKLHRANSCGSLQSFPDLVSTSF